MRCPAQDSDQYSEQKFLQVSRIIERFRGRDGLTEADRRWTRFVTDVRNWFTFAASERYREDDAEYEHYADSGGKSGGQKEKLAYTILAASLAYQFKLEWGAAKSRTFRFAVIDEAFGRGSDESTRFALELFGRLGLQLLIVTPLQKIHVIEPYVSAVGFVDNPQSNDSRLQTLTIEEYQARRLAYQLAQEVVEPRRFRGRPHGDGRPGRTWSPRRALTCRRWTRPADPRVDQPRRRPRGGAEEVGLRRAAGAVRRRAGVGAAEHPDPRPVRRADRRTPGRGPPVGRRVGGCRTRAAARGVQAGRRPAIRRRTASRAAPGWTATSRRLGAAPGRRRRPPSLSGPD